MSKEKRLIDANSFGMYLADVQLANRDWKDDVCDFLDDVMDALNEQPTVNAVELPCDAGKIVYVIDKGVPTRFEVNHFEVHRNTGVWAVLYDSVVATTRRITLNVKAFGKTVFFTREEAEKKVGSGEVPERCELCSEWNTATGWCKKHRMYTTISGHCKNGGA